METFSVGNNDGKESFDSSSFFFLPPKSSEMALKSQTESLFYAHIPKFSKEQKIPQFFETIYGLEDRGTTPSLFFFFSGNVCNE